MNKYPRYIKEINGSLWFTETDRDNLKLDYRIRKIIFCDKSEFQHVMILDSYDFGKMLILDGIVQTTEMDGFIYNEMISHVPLSFHPNPEKILIIGGGDLGAAREVVKYPCVKQIDVCEIDEMVVKVSREYLPEVSGNLSDPRLTCIFQDGVKYIQEVSPKSYDIIIVDSSDPVGPAVQLYESSFYRNVYKALKDDGIMVCQSQSPIFQADTFEQTYYRLSKLFPITKPYLFTVPTYPGGLFSFILGSKVYKEPVPENCFCQDTLYVNKDILKKCFLLPQFIKTKFFSG